MISGWSTIWRPWKPNSSTSVSSSAPSDTGPNRLSSACSATSPPRRSIQPRSIAATMTGTTMYSATDNISVAHGTVMDEMPSSRPTMGAKATSMIASFSATWLSVKRGSPSQRWLHTNTIAVHGAAARRISPATYESICAAGRWFANTWRTNSHASNAIENGLIAQFTNTVTPMPFQCRFTSPIARKSIFSSIGMIISQISTATGRFTLAISAAPKVANAPGSR